MNTELLTDFYKKRGIEKSDTAKAIEAVQALENTLTKSGKTLEDAPLALIRGYVEELAVNGKSDAAGMLAMARYFYLIDRKDVYIYFTQVFGGAGVIDSIKERMKDRVGEEKTQKVFEGLKEPPLGTPVSDKPEFIKKLMERAEAAFDIETLGDIFAGNNHGIPESSMDEERKAYNEAESLDEYLKQRHERKVKELQEHCDEDKIWFEQIITQDVVDFVAANQEILSAVREGSTLYVTKIPYDIVNFLKAEDKTEKRYYACHCPFVRESIKDGGSVSENWCYCSGGFAKFPFEQVLGRELKVKLLKSVLAGDEICRFAIDIGEDFK